MSVLNKKRITYGTQLNVYFNCSVCKMTQVAKFGSHCVSEQLCNYCANQEYNVGGVVNDERIHCSSI